MNFILFRCKNLPILYTTRNLKKKLTFFIAVAELFVSKSPKYVCFWFKSFLKLELWQMKSNFFLQNFRYFENLIYFFLLNPHLHVKNKRSFGMQNLKKFKLNVRFWIAPLIPENTTDILVYEKGGVLKHINAPAIVKVGVSDMWRK